MTGVFAALSYVVFTFLQIKITLPGGDATSIHLGNAVCVLGALILGGLYGGVGGALGMTIGDIFDPIYVIYAPKTFILKLCIGLITGLIAHKCGKITHISDKKKIFQWTLLAAIGGLAFNMVADPLVGYFYKLVILGKPAADITLAWNIASHLHQRGFIHHRFRCSLHGSPSRSCRRPDSSSGSGLPLRGNDLLCFVTIGHKNTENIVKKQRHSASRSAVVLL